MGREGEKAGTYAEHLPEVWISEPEGNVGDVQSLWLRLVFRAFGGLRLLLAVCLCCVVCLL